MSYVYLASFLRARSPEATTPILYEDWVLDSGAFSAWASGRAIDLNDYIVMCKDLIARDPSLTEVFSLDVIGDWKASLVNADLMWKAGVPAIPTFHINEPDHVLKSMAAQFPKIALGGVAKVRTQLRLRWAEQCFARVWPKKVHGFGFGDERSPMCLPFHSVDATSWAQQPQRFGLYKMWGDGIPVRGSAKINIRSNVDHYIDLEQAVSKRWRRELDQLEKIAPTKPLREAAKEIS